MKTALQLFLFFSILCLPAAAVAMGNPPPKETTLTGTLRMVGNEPFTALVLETSDKKLYEVTGEKKKELSAKQYYRVELTGSLENSNLPYAQDAINVRTFKLLQ